MLGNDAGQPAAVVPFQRHGRCGRLRAFVNIADFQRLGIEDRDDRQSAAPKTPDRPNIHWVIRRHAIEVPARRPAALLQGVLWAPIRRRISDRHRNDPFAPLRLLHQRLNAIEYVVDRGCAGERGKHRLEPFAIEVRVGVDQAGDHGAFGEIDAFGLGTRQRLDLGITANGEDVLARHRDSALYRKRGIDGDDFAPGEDPLCRCHFTTFRSRAKYICIYEKLTRRPHFQVAKYYTAIQHRMQASARSHDRCSTNIRTVSGVTDARVCWPPLQSLTYDRFGSQQLEHRCRCGSGEQGKVCDGMRRDRLVLDLCG